MKRSRLLGTTPEMAELMLRPSVATAWPLYERLRRAHGFPPPKDATKAVAALAMVHKARLGWPGSTKRMIKESKAWLVEHGMSPTIDAPHHGTAQ